ncbi:MAG: aminotransferase class I/II-fold pyridoxal phosphate-dependent enzyme [Aggregatilineales bacterium]
MPHIASRVAETGTTIFTEINQLAQRRGDVLNLGQGKPDFDTPPEILKAAIKAMEAGHNQYAPGTGIPALREGVAQHVKRFYDMDVDPDTGVVIASGASEAVYAAAMGIVNPGEEVILIEPHFDTYKPSIVHAGGIPVYVPLQPPNWTLDEAALRAAFNDNTKAIIINTPHNPTGRVFNMDELTLIADLCKEHDAIVISDEVYEHLVFEGHQHIPIATLPDMWDRTITVSSAAKTFTVTGWKVGWAYGHPDLVGAVWKVRQDITFAVHHASQYGIAHALTLSDDFYADYLAMYERKRDILLPALQSAGFKPFIPQGTFYIMADFTDLFDGGSRAFAEHLINEAGVACIPPGTFFSEAHRNLAQQHVRFSFCMQDDTLHRAADRLQKLRS